MAGAALDTIRALVKAAHAARMPVFIHATSTEAQEFALEAGVDIIAHGLWRWSGEPDVIALTPEFGRLWMAAEEKVGWQPTMQVGYGFRDLSILGISNPHWHACSLPP